MTLLEADRGAGPITIRKQEVIEIADLTVPAATEQVESLLRSLIQSLLLLLYLVLAV